MARINLRPFLSTCREHRPLVISTMLLLIHLFSVSTKAQTRIIVIEKDRRTVGLPTTEVTRIVGATRKRESIRAVPMNIEIGDELVGNSGAVVVKLRCSNADVLLSGQFRVRLLPAVGRDCNLDFPGKPGAAMNVTARGPTNIQSGAARLGTRRTVFKVGIPDKKGFFAFLSRMAMPRVWAFKDPILVTSPFFTGPLEPGNKLDAEGNASPTITTITIKDAEDAARIYAEAGVALATSIPKSPEAEAAAFARLVALYQEFLTDPDNAAKIKALEKAQEEYGIPGTDTESSSGQSQQPTASVNLTLKPGTKGTANFPFTNGCKKSTRIRFAAENLPFARFLSAAEPMVIAGGQITTRIELNAAGLKPGTYSGTVMVTCLDCPKGCEMVRQQWQVTVQVE